MADMRSSRFILVILSVLFLSPFVHAIDTVEEDISLQECPWDNVRHLQPEHPFHSVTDTLNGGMLQEDLTLMKLWIQRIGRSRISVTALFGIKNVFAGRHNGYTPEFQMTAYRPDSCLLSVVFPGLNKSDLPLLKPLPCNVPGISRAYITRTLEGYLNLHIWFDKQQQFFFALDEEYSRFRVTAVQAHERDIFQRPEMPYWLLWLYPPDEKKILDFHRERAALYEPWLNVLDKENNPALLNPGYFMLRNTASYAAFHLNRSALKASVQQIYR